MKISNRAAFLAIEFLHRLQLSQIVAYCYLYKRPGIIYISVSKLNLQQHTIFKKFISLLIHLENSDSMDNDRFTHAFRTPFICYYTLDSLNPLSSFVDRGLADLQSQIISQAKGANQLKANYFLVKYL